MTKVVTPNYTPAQEDFIRNFVGTGLDGALNFGDCVVIAADPSMVDVDGNHRKPRSITAKINRMGLRYENKGKVRKDGTAVATKEKLVDQISSLTGITFEGLDKSPRGDLVSLRDYFAEVANG